jgi:hypothetical protein
LETTDLEVLVKLGAGDIDRLVPSLAEWSRVRAKRLGL